MWPSLIYLVYSTHKFHDYVKYKATVKDQKLSTLQRFKFKENNQRTVLATHFILQLKHNTTQQQKQKQSKVVQRTKGWLVQDELIGLTIGKHASWGQGEHHQLRASFSFDIWIQSLRHTHTEAKTRLTQIVLWPPCVLFATYTQIPKPLNSHTYKWKQF